MTFPVTTPVGAHAQDPELAQNQIDLQAVISTVGLVSAKGSLLSHDGSAHAALGVGSDGDVLIADSTAASGLKWGTVSGGSAPWSLATKPASPDSRDDEFEGANLNAAWTVLGTTRDGDPDMTQNMTVAAHYRSSHDSYRPSYYMVQSNTANATPDIAGSIYKSITFVSGDFVYIRFSTNAGNAYSSAVTRYDGSILLHIYDTLGFTNYLAIDYNYSGANNITFARGGVGSTTFGVTCFSTVAPTQPPLFSYMGIYRTGNDAWFFIGTPEGSWNAIGKQANWFNFTPAYIRIGFGNANTSTPARIAGVDFIRFTSAKLP